MAYHLTTVIMDERVAHYPCEEHNVGLPGSTPYNPCIPPPTPTRYYWARCHLQSLALWGTQGWGLLQPLMSCQDSKPLYYTSLLTRCWARCHPPVTNPVRNTRISGSYNPFELPGPTPSYPCNTHPPHTLFGTKPSSSHFPCEEHKI